MSGKRPWILDMIAAIALLALAVMGGKGISRAVGPIPGLFFLVFFGGLAWYYFRGAWGSLIEGREGKR